MSGSPIIQDGERCDRRQWRPRCSALPVAETAEHKRVQGSVADAAGLSARKIPGTPNGRSDPSEWQRPRARALPVADAARAQSVPWSAGDAAARSKETAGHHKRSARDEGTRAEDIRRAPQQGIYNNAAGIVHLHGARSFVWLNGLYNRKPVKKELAKPAPHR